MAVKPIVREQVGMNERAVLSSENRPVSSHLGPAAILSRNCWALCPRRAATVAASIAIWRRLDFVFARGWTSGTPCDPDRVRRLGVEGLRRFVARRGVALSTPKASDVIEAARVALRLPAAERSALGRVLAADVVLLSALEA